MSRILLTGATGFLGSHIASMLVGRAVDCTAIVRNPAFCPLGCKPIIADLIDGAALCAEARKVADFDTLMHVAATMPNPSLSVAQAMALHKNEIRIAENLITIFSSVRHVIFASSLDVYGAPAFLPITEEHPLRPLTEYAKAKVEVENMLEGHCSDSGKTLTIMRITHIYGPGEPCIKAMPLFISTIIKGGTPTIFGDGSEIRDFVYVSDVASAFVSAMEQSIGGTFIIGSGQSVTVREALNEIIRLSGKRIEPVVKERQKPKIDLVIDVKKAKSILGWQARMPFLRGLQSEYDWYLKKASS